MAAFDSVLVAVVVDSAALLGSCPDDHDPDSVGELYCRGDHVAGEATDYAEGAITEEVEYTSVICSR